MSRVTRFAARDEGPAARMAGFLAHLRVNGLRLGVEETELSLSALTHADPANPQDARRALKAVCTGSPEDYDRFDDLFDAFWLNGGRVVRKSVSSAGVRRARSPHGLPERQLADGAGRPKAVEDDANETGTDGKGRMVASALHARAHRNLRELLTSEDVAEAERIARRLGEALRDQRSRRRVAARHGDRIHFRELMRQSLSTGGEPLHLPRKRRPDRPVKIVALCDVSGSMTLYARVYLAFVAGLIRADDTSDAYLFHTRLVRIAEALRDRDGRRSIARLSLLAEGYGGGSRIGASLYRFARTYARRFVDGRTVVMVMSDGYDTDPPEMIGDALATLKRRGCRIIWLNPLMGRNRHEPVARGMAAALPYLDLLRPAGTLDDLAELERYLVRP